MSLLQSNSKVTTSTGFYSFPIEQSLRFDGSSYLSRTATSGNRKKYTLSMWLKFAISSASNTGDVALFGQGNGIKDTLMLVQGTADKFWFLDRNGTTSYYQAPGNINDISAWYNVVYVIDTPNSSSNSDPPASTDRVRIYINGTQQLLSMYTGGTHQLAVDHDTQINNTTYSTVYMGKNPYAASGYFSGYMAEVNFLDGYAPTTSNGGLDSSGNLQVLGETKNGVWIPKNPSGLTYGTNGFRLTFENGIETIGGVANQIRDESSNSNHWTAN